MARLPCRLVAQLPSGSVAQWLNRLAAQLTNAQCPVLCAGAEGARPALSAFTLHPSPFTRRSRPPNAAPQALEPPTHREWAEPPGRFRPASPVLPEG